MSHPEALVQPLRGAALLYDERRAAVRHACSMEATSHALDDVETIAWGAAVADISPSGVGITLCFPFRLGTYLAVDLHGSNGMLKTVLVRVVHVRDRFDGSYHLGCEFVKPLASSELELLI